MIIDVLTLFPEMFDSIMNKSIIGRAQEKELIQINPINFRNFSNNKHGKVDDYPYGGGSGMVIMNQPIFDALEYITDNKTNYKVVYLTPKGKKYNQQIAKSLAKEDHLIFICGHYEGIDQRIIDYWVTDEISIGDYVLTGGELPAMVVIDSIARLIPGVLSSNDSYTDESFYNGLLEYPHYTRPSNFNGLKVPDVLLSGNHKLIEDWRLEESIKITLKRRPDLIAGLLKDDLSVKEKEKIENIIRKINK